jgi:hypothetical protein
MLVTDPPTKTSSGKIGRKTGLETAEDAPIGYSWFLKRAEGTDPVLCEVEGLFLTAPPLRGFAGFSAPR